MCVLSRNSNKKKMPKRNDHDILVFFSFTFILRFVKKIFLLHLFSPKKVWLRTFLIA